VPDLETILERLVRGGVDFVVVGGFAAVAHGGALPTQDLDICCGFSTDNLTKLGSALSGLHPLHRMVPACPPLRLTPEDCRGFKNLYLETDLGQLDCVGAVDGVGEFEEVRAASDEVALAFGKCRVLSLDALIRSKEAMHRPRDREAAAQLKAIRERSGGDHAGA